MERKGRFECVANVSEGRDAAVIDPLASACGAALLDVHRDPDHHRSVFTLGGPLERVTAAARRLAELAAAAVDLGEHAGAHPRLGALDVAPFVPLDPAGRDAAVAAAREFAGWVAGTLEVPVFLYGDAAPSGRSLPDVRRHAFRDLHPDFGPPRPHPTAGACAVGARPVLVAVNCNLATPDAAVARAIAGEVRERDGGLAGVRALGLELRSRNVAQVSMNLVDLGATGVEAACTAVRRAAAARGTDVAEVELVGLMPASEITRSSDGFLAWAGLDESRTIEARLAATA